MKRRRLVAVMLLVGAIATAATAFFVVGLPFASPCLGTSGNAREFTIIADLNGFNGSKNQLSPWPVIKVEKCDEVTIRFVNQDHQTHGFAVDFYANSGLAPQGGQNQTLSFRATKTGQFRVYCYIFCTVHIFMQNGLLDVAITQPLHAGLRAPIGFGQQPTSTSPYMVLFQVQKNSSDANPFVLYPVSAKTAWLVTFKPGTLSKPYHSYIVNFTVGQEPRVVANLTNVSTASITVDGLGRVWFPKNDTLAYYDPARRSLVDGATFAGGGPWFIAVDSRGRVWSTLVNSNEIALYDPTSGLTSRYPLPTSKALLQGISAGPDGMIWFLEAGARKLGRLDPNNGNVIEYPAPPEIKTPTQLAVDKKGTVWFTDHGTNQFGSFNPTTREWRIFPVGACSNACPYALPNAIALDPQGNIWFSEHLAGRVAKYDPDSGILTEYIIPAPQGVPRTGIGNWWAWPGPSNLVWFTAIDLGMIGYVNASVPTPLKMSAPEDHIVVQQAGYAGLPLMVEYSGSGTVTVGLSPPTQDYARYTVPLSIQPTPLPTRLFLGLSSYTVTAAGSMSLGGRTVAVTASDGEISMSVYVKVNVTPPILAYATITTALVNLASGMVFYVRRRRQASGQVSKTKEEN